MPDSSTLPTTTYNSVGSATAGTITAGAFEGPLTVIESGLSFFRPTRPLTLKDATIGLATGAAAAQSHAFLVSVGQVNNVIGILYSAAARPDTAMRTVPALNIPAGQDIFVRAVQLSGVAAEATTLTLFWSKAKA